jgi:hypothetical protein
MSLQAPHHAGASRLPSNSSSQERLGWNNSNQDSFRIAIVVCSELLDLYPSFESNRMIGLILIDKTMGVGLPTSGEHFHLLIHDDNHADRMFSNF